MKKILLILFLGLFAGSLVYTPELISGRKPKKYRKNRNSNRPGVASNSRDSSAYDDAVAAKSYLEHTSNLVQILHSGSKDAINSAVEAIRSIPKAQYFEWLQIGLKSAMNAVISQGLADLYPEGGTYGDYSSDLALTEAGKMQAEDMPFFGELYSGVYEPEF